MIYWTPMRTKRIFWKYVKDKREGDFWLIPKVRQKNEEEVIDTDIEGTVCLASNKERI